MKTRDDEPEGFSCHGMRMNNREMVNTSENQSTQKKKPLTSLLIKLKALIANKPRKLDL